jgi:hypothetical protein
MSERLNHLRRSTARLARAATGPIGRATSSARMLPGFLIVGAQRAGTTSLYKYLASHPDVGRVRFGKGVHYFDTNFDRPLSWYRGHFPLEASRLPLLSRPSLVGEGAPYYMYHPQCSQRIEATLPGVKIIAILRDPIERAHSQWAHETARGFETLPFAEAIEAEGERLSGAEVDLVDPAGRNFSHQHHSYVARGQYAQQVDRLWGTFGRDRVLVLPSPRLFETPGEAYAETLSFLGLASHDAEYEVHNARSYSKIDPALEAELNRRFSASNDRLVAMLGSDFDFRRG